MQGLAAAGAIPSALGILGANYGPGRRKNKVFASFSAGNPVGAALGLVIGGALTSHLFGGHVILLSTEKRHLI